METAKRKMAGMGAVRHCADGGFISKLFGSSKPAETVTEKFARQDAERAAKAKPAASAAAPRSSNAISNYADMGVIQRREKEAGMKDGGAIKGPGTGTSDDVPIMASHGEFMIKAAAVKKIGVPALEALNAIADKPGGAIKKMHKAGHMFQGGLVDEEARRAQLLSQIPATGGSNPAPTPDGKNNTEFSRNVGNTLMALPGGAPTLGAISTIARSAPVIGNVLAATGSGIGALATKVAPYAAPAAGIGALSAASSPAAPATPPSTPTASTPAGAIQKPAPIVASPTAVDTAPAAVTSGASSTPVSPGMSQAVIDQALTNPDGSRWSAQDNAVMAANLRDGLDPYRGTSRQANDTAPAAYDPSSAVRRLNDITSPEYEAMRRLKMASDPGRRSGESGRGARGRAQGAISQMADLQSEVLGGSRQLANAQMTDATARRGQDQTAVAQGAVRKLAQDRLTLDATKAGQDAKGASLDNESKAGVLAAQKALAAAKTPAERLAAEDNLRALQGKYGKEPAPDLYDKVQTGVDPTTNAPIYSLYNKRTGEVAGQGKAAVPDAATAKTQALAALKANPANKDEINKRLAAAGYQPI